MQRVGRGLVPDRDTIFQDGDLLYVAVANQDVSAVEQVLGQPPLKH